MFVLITDTGVMEWQKCISYNIDGGHLMFFACEAILNGLFFIWTNIKHR